eukprot:TRINITY_DN371_c0_g2_i2.p1 TRINITY_DN371_c0_g2~~TRINITY_DN371_c0_g2_i2.p1  ORF type:complete len:209 (+),score=6.39 TRINITY_DN371_c0_g2_i2:124-750(+)
MGERFMQCEFLDFGEIVQNSLDWPFHVGRIIRQFGDVFDLNCFSTRRMPLFTRCEDAVVSSDGHNKMNGRHRFERTCVLERTSPFKPARGFMSLESMKASASLRTEAGRTEAARINPDRQRANHRDCELRLHPIESANGPPLRDASRVSVGSRVRNALPVSKASSLENALPGEVASSNRVFATFDGSSPSVSNSVQLALKCLDCFSVT